MKITIYELLGLIKEGKAPKKIKYDNYEWVFIDDEYMSHKLQETLFTDYIEGNYCVIECLNDEVEVIEEEKEIEKLNLDTDELLKNVVITAQDYVIEGKINELIDVINDMRDKE